MAATQAALVAGGAAAVLPAAREALGVVAPGVAERATEGWLAEAARVRAAVAAAAAERAAAAATRAAAALRVEKVAPAAERVARAAKAARETRRRSQSRHARQSHQCAT